MKYRKKPAEIEARQWRHDLTTTEAHAITSWMEDGGYPWLIGDYTNPDTLRDERTECSGTVVWQPTPCSDQACPMHGTSTERPTEGIWLDPADGALMIRTLEGDMKVTPDSWIIRGVQGEFYPCRDDIFRATYEEADRPKTGHEIVVTHDNDMARYTVVCNEPDDANCHLVCNVTGYCGEEGFAIERDSAGPFHTAWDDDADEYVRHDLTPTPECNPCAWLNADPSVTAELRADMDRDTFEVGRFPIHPLWENEEVLWERVTTTES